MQSSVELSLAASPPPNFATSVDGAPYRSRCAVCGVSRTVEPDRCGRACQFIKPDDARVLHLRRALPRRLRTMVPAHVWALVEPYGLRPTDSELPVRPTGDRSADGAGPA